MKSQCAIINADLSRKAHCAALVALIDEYRRGPTGDGCRFDPPAQERLVKGLKTHPAARVYFAAVGNVIAGCAICFIGYSTFQDGKLLNVHDLIVTKKFRRKGVARGLLKHIEGESAAQGFCRITLEVRHDNARALNLYITSGFSQGKYPMYFMSKTLR